VKPPAKFFLFRGERIRYLEAENKRLLEEWNRLTGDLEMALDREWDAEEEINQLRKALENIGNIAFDGDGLSAKDLGQDITLLAKQALEGSTDGSR
jgi:hypothetical protein